MPDVTVVMVTHNSAGVVEASLNAALADMSVAACTVVDNASTDATVAFLRQRFPQVNIINNMENRGFGAANNQVLEKVTTKYALLLNPDAIPDAGAIAALVQAAECYTQAAIIAPLIRSPEGEFETSFKRDVFHREQHRSVWQIPEGDISAEFVSGAVCLLRMQCFLPSPSPSRGEGLAVFDPAIFFYYEDDDLCLRARRAGHGIVVTPASLFTHLKGRSSAPSAALDAWKQRQLITSRIYLEKKYRGEKAAARMRRKIRLNALGKMFLYGFIGRQAKWQKHAARFQAASARKID